MIRKRTDLSPGRLYAARKLSLGVLVPVLVCGLFFMTKPASAQNYTTVASGSWISPSTWQGGQPPTSPTDNITISANDSVTTNPLGLVQCKNLTIDGGAKLMALGSGIQMTGAFSIAAGGTYISSTDSAKAWPAGASSYSISPTSTFVLYSGGNSTLGWSKSDSTFGNVIIYPNVSGGIVCGANLTILGNLVINAGQGSYFRGISATVAANDGITGFVHHVDGNVTVVSGNWAAVDMGSAATVAPSCTWDVNGNVQVGVDTTSAKIARMSPITSEDDLGAKGVFNIKGNLSFVNGGRLAPGSNSSSSQSPKQIAQLNLSGNVTFDSTAYEAVNSEGNFIINFVGTKPQTVTLESPFSVGSNTVCTVWDTIAAGANVTFTGGNFWRSDNVNAPDGPGAFVVEGTCNFGPADTLKGVQKFILAPGGTLGIGSPSGIFASADSGAIQTDTTRDYSSSANYVYNGTSAQVTGDGLPTTVNDLTIDNAAGVKLSQATTINGSLYLEAGTFDNSIGTKLGPNGKVVNDGGKVTVPLAVKSTIPSVPKEFSLAQNYPNPFNPTTRIEYSVPNNSFVTLKVYNILGQRVATLYSGVRTPGNYSATFNGSSLASGVYIYRLQAGATSITKKLMLLK